MPSNHEPRKRRYNIELQPHELTFSCFRRYRFLLADRTCRWLADAIADGKTTWAFELWAYVFMPEHVHLIVVSRRREYDIADIKQAIKEPVGREAIDYLHRHARDWLPRLTVRKGKRERRYFWQPGGGYDRNVEEPRTLMQMIEYIHLNPVRRGLVQRARDWRWSSAAYFEGMGDSPVPLDPIPAEWVV